MRCASLKWLYGPSLPYTGHSASCACAPHSSRRAPRCTRSSTSAPQRQLPAKSAEATERSLLRQAAGAKPGAPTPEVAEAVAAVRRYFDGKETDFSRFKLDLGAQDPFFERIYAAARRVGWGHTTIYGALAREL